MITQSGSKPLSVEQSSAHRPLTEPAATRRRRKGIFRSLRWRMIHLLGAVLLGAHLILGTGVFYVTIRLEKELTRAGLRDDAHQAAETVSAYVQHTAQALTLISLMTPDSLAAAPQPLEVMLQQDATLQEVTRLDARGQVVASAHRDASTLAGLPDTAQTPWFRAAISGTEYLGLTEGEAPYLVMAIPTADGGVLAARLAREALAESGLAVTGEGYITYIVDATGHLIAHADPAVALSGADLAGRPELTETLQAPDHAWSGTYVNFQGEQVMGSATAVAGTDWLVITEVPQAGLSDVNRIAIVLVSVGTLTLVGLVLAVTAWFLRPMVFEPMEKLRAGAERIGQGDLEHQMDIAGGDEIGQVADAFNDMTRRLHSRTQELVIARRQAEEANRLKSEFLATMSHELRTPLNAMIGFAEIMLAGMGGTLDADATHMTERIHANSKRLLMLINDVLDLAKIEARRIDVVTKPFAPQAMLETVREQMMGLAEQKHVGFEVRIDPRLPSELAGDEVLIQRVAINLLSNAFKFTEAGLVTLLADLGEDNDTWTISVLDTGVGIPPHALEYIFDPFRQVDGSPQRAYQGTGLGLAIVRELVRVMNGTVRVESVVGRGSTFIVTLPLVAADEAVKERASV
jgi:signal transduction histidine kinase